MIVAALTDQGIIGKETDDALSVSQVIASVHRFLARSPAQLMFVNLDDIMMVLDQLNLRGTTDEDPNWRRRLPIALEDLDRSAAWNGTLRIMNEERPRGADGAA